MLRTFKYLRIVIIIFQKDSWEKGHKLFICIFEALIELRRIMLIWLIIVLTLSLIGYHLNTYEDGEQVHQISFENPYKSLIFTLLIMYDEEWDVLMFQEYLENDTFIIIWVLLLMIVGYVIFSKYLTCLLSRNI